MKPGDTTTSTPGLSGNLACFLGLTLLFSGIAFALMLAGNTMGAAGGIVSYMLVAMWGPGLAAILTCRLRGVPLASLGWTLGPPRWAWLAYVLPLGYSLVAYVAVWLTGAGGFYNREKVAQWATEFGWAGVPDGAVIVFSILLLGSFGMLKALNSALGEEIGWRGFLVPQLARRWSYVGVSLWSGAIWAIYHWPALIFADYAGGAPLWFSLPCFSIMVVSLSFVLTWLRLRSGSLWPAAILHASHNLFIQAMFQPLTVDTGHTAWFAGEAGVALAIVTTVVALCVLVSVRDKRGYGPPKVS